MSVIENLKTDIPASDLFTSFKLQSCSLGTHDRPFFLSVCRA
ncbi:MAG: hypothetical protein ACI9S8_002375, partial [Chlamydiales bacterium]